MNEQEIEREADKALREIKIKLIERLKAGHGQIETNIKIHESRVAMLDIKDVSRFKF